MIINITLVIIVDCKHSRQFHIHIFLYTPNDDNDNNIIIIIIIIIINYIIIISIVRNLISNRLLNISYKQLYNRYHVVITKPYTHIHCDNYKLSTTIHSRPNRNSDSPISFTMHSPCHECNLTIIYISSQISTNP